jgi:hypothetical protein
MPRIVIALSLTLACSTLLGPSPAGEPKRAMPTNLGKVNTKADEDDPFIMVNKTTVLYASNAAGTFDIMVSQAKPDGKLWSAGKPLAGCDSKEADERSPFFSARDNKLYFATNEVPDEKLKDLKNFDIKVRASGRAPLIVPGISEKEDELHPWITPAGKEFYFSRKTEKGWILFVARGPVPGPIGGAKPVGFPPGFHHASLSASGLLMYLQGPLDDGRTGLFHSKRTKVGAAWSDPEPLAMLNSPEAKRGDMSPCLSSDGTRLFFASDRPGGAGGLDLWMVETAQLTSK